MGCFLSVPVVNVMLQTRKAIGDLEDAAWLVLSKSHFFAEIGCTKP